MRLEGRRAVAKKMEFHPLPMILKLLPHPLMMELDLYELLRWKRHYFKMALLLPKPFEPAPEKSKLKRRQLWFQKWCQLHWIITKDQRKSNFVLKILKNYVVVTFTISIYILVCTNFLKEICIHTYIIFIFLLDSHLSIMTNLLMDLWNLSCQFDVQKDGGT